LRIARALAAAALTLGLTATLAPAAQAVPTTEVAAATAVRAADAPKAQVTAKAPKGKVKVGKTIKVTGKLTHKTKNGSAPLPNKNIVLSIGYSENMIILAEATTTKSGTFTLKSKAKKWMIGENEARVLYANGSTPPAFVTLRVKK
jgi:hypothetical protein